MADGEDDWTGRDHLSAAWWEALGELRMIVDNPEGDVTNRIRAAEVILTYTASINVGLGEPFIPDREPAYDDDDEEDRR